MRVTWAAYGDDAADEFRDARNRCPAAGNHDLDSVTGTLSDAADDMAGVLRVVRSVLTEHQDGMEDCITDFENTDGNSAGEFNALGR